MANSLPTDRSTELVLVLDSMIRFDEILDAMCVMIQSQLFKTAASERPRQDGEP